MANEQELMALMSQGQPGQGGGALPPGAPSPDISTPMTDPMSTPEPKAGQKEAAMINVSMALDLIEQALPAVGSETPEGKKLMSALSALTGLLGPKKQKTGELQNAEILQLLQNLPQAGGGTPGSRMIAGSPPNLGLMGQTPPAAPLAGAPPMGAPPAGGAPMTM